MAITFKTLPKGSTIGSGSYIFRHYGDEAPVELPDYLCFTAEEAGSTVAMDAYGTPTQGQMFEYSTNGTNWSEFIPETTTITLANVGNKVYFRGDNITVSESTSVYYKFVMSGKIAASGNIMSLLDKTCQSTRISKDYCYYNMFRGCTSLTTAPALPATTLANNCYNHMFYGCTSLTTAPTLPATKLTTRCYDSMFHNCANLTTAPALPATTLANNCYNYMFNGCTSLTTAPALPATVLTDYCYYFMFNGCTSLTTAPALPATTLASNCYNYMFRDCTSLTTAPALPATVMAQNCYINMFYGCTSLTTAPALPATTLANNCYNSMFYNCANLTTAPALPATTLASSCYGYMFSGCTSLQVYSSSGTGHTKTWRIPTSGSASSYTSQKKMFYKCPGSYGTTTSVSLNRTFYTQNTPV